MADPANEKMSVQHLEHRKAPSFVQDYADRINILISDTPGMARSINLIFGRDTADVVEERLVPNPSGGAAMTPTNVVAYRYELASITMPEHAARSLAESILASLNNPPSAPTEA